MRTYEQTHSWITFHLDLGEADYQTWMLLGEAQSKCKHLAGAPLLPVVAEQLQQVFLAKGVLATTAIEGNTLSEQEVLSFMKGELQLPPSKEYLGQEIDNVIQGCNVILNKVMSGQPTELTLESICEYNRLILQNLPLNEDVVPGVFRSHNIMVGTYRGAPPNDVEYLLERMCEWLNNQFRHPEGYEIAFGILKAIAAHIYIAWIHPFADGNGRTARLVELQFLLSVGIPAAAAHLLSNHYNQTRTDYYRQLERAHRTGGDILPFIKYAFQGFVDGLAEQIQLIQAQQVLVHWMNHIHELLGEGDATTTRRRKLILDLSKQHKAVPVNEVRHISPRIAEAYAKRTDKTIQRDLRALEALDLIVRDIDAKTVRPKREKMYAFLSPARGKPNVNILIPVNPLNGLEE